MRIKRLVATFALLLAFAAAVPAADKPPVNDNYINDSVREKLASDADVKGGAIEVDVKDGVVTLNGKVQTQKQKNKAETLAKKVKGVKSVVDNLKISPL
jgi:osmotically-inducible protein OsmY